MQRLGRLQLVLGYWPEIRYLIQAQGNNPDEYAFHPIQGVNRYQFLHVGCSDTVLGREAVRHIDQLLLTLRRETLPAFYARWLAPEEHEQYLIDSQHFSAPRPKAPRSTETASTGFKKKPRAQEGTPRVERKSGDFPEQP